MARTRTITIKPPLGGNVRSSAYQSAEPYTTPLSVNVWGVDAKTGRKRIASRPRLATYGSGGGSLIRGIYQVNVATNQTLTRGLFCIGSGNLYRYISGTFTSEGSGFGTSGYISACAYLTKLFIADGAAITQFECATNTLTANPTATAGTKPTNCRLVCEWNGRLVLSGDTASPHAVYMSRVGDPLDWDYAETDISAAVNFTTLDGGLIGEKVTALISHNRECLLIGGTDSLHVVRGDPLDGGRLEILSHVIGPLGQSAWCKTGDDQTIIATRNGLYVMAPGCGAAPVPLSRERIPDSLVGIDTSTYEVHLAFDTRFNGVHIYKTAIAGSTGEAWWLDWDTGAYWPMEYSSAEMPTSVMRFDPLDGADISGVLLGCTSGGIRQFDRTNTGTITNTNIYLGPIKLSSSPMEKGIIQKMQCTMGGNNSDTTGTIAVYCAETAELAFVYAQADTAYRKYSMTIANQNNNLISYPRVGGHAAVIKVAAGATNTHLSLEEITLTIREAGMMR